MPAYNKAKIQGYLQIVNNPPSKHAKGKAFEELACCLFTCVPRITIIDRNEMNTFAAEEIDVACNNKQDSAGLRSFNAFFLVECKGWTDAVGSEQGAWFLMKIEHRGLDFGVLIAANGITGVAEHLSASHFLVAVTLATKKIRTVIVTRQEIENLNSGEELADLIIRKVTQLHATGGRCY